MLKVGKYRKYREITKETTKLIRKHIAKYSEIEVEKLMEKNRIIELYSDYSPQRWKWWGGKKPRNTDSDSIIYVINPEEYAHRDTRQLLSTGPEEIPEITPQELKHTLNRLKNNKPPREDSVLIEMVREEVQLL